MKLEITLKQPDVLECAIKEAIANEVELMNLEDTEEVEYLLESRKDEEMEKLEKWVKYSEQVTIKFDTDEMTARVIPLC